MKPAFAHLAPTVLITFAAAMGIALSVFLLPGAGVQGEPTPLLAVIGGAAGRRSRGSPGSRQPSRFGAGVGCHSRAGCHSRPARRNAVRAVRAATATRRGQDASVHRHTRTPGRSAPGRPSPAGGCARRTHNAGDDAPVPRQSEVGKEQVARPQPCPGAEADRRDQGAAARARGKAKALGHSIEHHDGLPPGQAKKAPTAPQPAPTTPPKANAGGNGNNGGKK